ncbi:MAG: glutamate--tRNA ligase [Chloroflexi bacterium]|nr:glutamate--tRNA ligase [Chloroflexota bacterium]
MANRVRVRLAPSPTGPLHVGRARTALFNWLFARHNGGVFVLRIEDTDRQRSTEANLVSILDSLRWLGLDWDEGPDIGGPYGPYFQMQRLETYRQAAERLLANGAAYKCYCSVPELEAMRQEAKAAKVAFRYPGRCLRLTREQIAQFEAEGRRPVIRFIVPKEGTTTFRDMIHGDITVNNSELDDLVIVKSDGIPTYNFAAVIDDTTMEMTHVIRGDDHIANTPKQIHVYRALGYTPPEFGHLPMILGLDRAKLSSRHGAAAVTDFAAMGYLPEAMMNYLALLGWSYDDKREFFSREELIKYFDISRVGKTGAAFSMQKLEWMNGAYVRGLSPDALVVRALPFLQEAGLVSASPPPSELAYVRQVMPLVHERLKRLAEVAELTDFFFKEQLEYDGALLVGKGMTADQSRLALEAAQAAVASVDVFNVPSLEAAIRPQAERLGLSTGQLFGTIRVAVTGRTVAPPLFETMAVLGRERCARRIQQALTKLPSGIPR